MTKYRVTESLYIHIYISHSQLADVWDHMLFPCLFSCHDNTLANQMVGIGLPVDLVSDIGTHSAICRTVAVSESSYSKL